MKTKKQLVASLTKRFSRRLRNRQRNEIVAVPEKSFELVDTRKSIDQFQQNEFLKYFELESTSGSECASITSNEPMSLYSRQTSGMSDDSFDICHGFPTPSRPLPPLPLPLPPIITRCKRLRAAKSKSTIVPMQYTSMVSYDEQLLTKYKETHEILAQKNHFLRNILKEAEHRQHQFEQCKRKNVELKKSIKMFGQHIQALVNGI